MRLPSVSLDASMTAAGFYTPKRVDKPWGHEIVFGHYAEANGVGYLGKLLYVRKGHSLSFQYHEQKTETLMVLYGKVTATIGAREDALEQRVLDTTTVLHLPSGYLHRVEALEDTCVVEVSTPYPNDTVRINDLYGRIEGAVNTGGRMGGGRMGAPKRSAKRRSVTRK